MIETLLEIEVATRMLREGKEKEKAGGDSAAGAAAANSSVATSNDPIDIHYRQLKTAMTVVEKSTEEFNLISTYITNTHAPTHKVSCGRKMGERGKRKDMGQERRGPWVLCVLLTLCFPFPPLLPWRQNYTLDLLEAFCVDRENEGDRYKPFEANPNRMLLWVSAKSRGGLGPREGEAQGESASHFFFSFFLFSSFVTARFAHDELRGHPQPRLAHRAARGARHWLHVRKGSLLR